MKKMLYFIPTTVVFVLLVFVLIILVGPTNQLSEYMIGIAILICAYYLIWGVITYKKQKKQK